MTVGRLKQIHLFLTLGISIFIPLFLAYSVYVDLSGTVLLSSDMSFEDSGDGDLSTCEDDFNVYIPMLPSNPLLLGTHFGKGSRFSSSPFTSHNQITPVLRC